MSTRLVHIHKPWGWLLKRLKSQVNVSIMAAVLAIMSGSACLATTYYVSNSGNDSNSGTSSSSPWQTCAKVNSTTFSPGDSILFQSGGIWHEQLSAGSNGTSGSPITYSSYGSGNKPIFTGGDTLNNASFVPVSGYSNVYTYNDTTTVNSVLENQVFLQSGNPESAPNTWSYSNGVLMISTSSGDDPRTDGAVFTACTRVDELFTNYHNYLTYTNLVAENTALYNDGYCIRSMGSIGITYNYCDAYYGGKHNFGIINSTQVTLNNCTAAYEMPGQGNGGATLFVSYADTDPGGQSAASSTYNNCTASNSQDTSSPGAYYPAFTCHGGQLGQTTFNNFTTTYGAFTVLQDGGATNEHVYFNGGTINSADFEVYGNGSTLVDGTTFTGNSAFDIWSTNDTFQNCKMQDLLFNNGGQTGYNAAIVVRSGATGNTFRFNTVVMDPSASSSWPCLTLVSSGSHTNWYGNIFLSNGMVVAPFYFTPSSSDVGHTDYNFYNSNATFGYSNLTLAQWQADTGADTHSQTGNPQFVSQTGNNYNLQSSSPAINAAPIPSSWLSGTPSINHDFNGNPRPSGSTYDMGAFEYQSSGPSETPYGGTAWAIPGMIQAENYDNGGQNVAYYDTDAGNNGGQYRSDDVDITTCSDTNGGYQVGWTAAGEYLKYTVNVASSGNYDFQARVACGGSNGSIHFEVDGTNVTGSMTFSSTGSYQTYETVVKTGVALTAGTHIIKLYEETNGFDVNWFNVVASAGSSETPYGGTAWAIPGTVQAENYDNGGQNVAYYDADSGNNGGAYRSDDVDIRATSDTGGGYQVGWTNTGEWLKYTVNVTASGSYVFNARVASGGNGGTIHFEVDGTNVTGSMTVPVTGSYDTFTTISSGSVSMTAGAHVIRLYEDLSNGFDINWFSVTAAAPAQPVVTSSTTASGTVGTTFSYTITATNSPTSYGATGLPAGLSVNTSTGVISGTPTASGTSTVTISATNAGGTGTATLTLTINAGAPSPPVVTSSTSAPGATGTAFSYTITATNSPTSYNETGTLPAGLSLNTSTGVISGTPTAAGTSTITIKATNAGGTGSASLTITITAASSHLTGSLGTDSGTINLTTEGTTDWGHFGSEGSGNWDHKSGGNAIGWNAAATVFPYGSDPVSFLWTDGGQNWNGQAQATGFYFNGNGGTAGFSVTAPADLTTRTLKFYVSSMGGTGTLSAHLSDNSSPDYTNTSLAVNGEGVYTIVYSAASAGQTLTVNWYDPSSGRLAVQSVSLH